MTHYGVLSTLIPLESVEASRNAGNRGRGNTTTLQFPVGIVWYYNMVQLVVQIDTPGGYRLSNERAVRHLCTAPSPVQVHYGPKIRSVCDSATRHIAGGHCGPRINASGQQLWACGWFRRT